jgi:hypothetical protein
MDALEIPRRLGPSQSHSLGLNDQLEVDAAAASFAAKVAPWLRTAQDATLQQIADATDQSYDDIAAATDAERPGWLDAAQAALTAGFASMAIGFLYNPSPGAPDRGEVPDLAAPRDAIRQALQLAGGGDPGSGPPLGIGTGPMAGDALDSGGATVDSWVWSYNDLARTTFPGHLQLDGIEFTSWEDDQLAIQPEDDWLGVDFYVPGDHDGCGCSAEPSVVPADEAGPNDGSELVGAEA